MVKGTKRGSPGAELEKSPLQNVELSDEDAKKLQQVQRDIARAELVLERHAQSKLVSVYEQRRKVIQTISNFWPIALMNHTMFAYHAQHNSDQSALVYLEDLWVARDRDEPRCFTIEFHFKENPYFSDKVLKKEYKYVAPLAAAGETPDADGITDSILDFSWERDVVASSTKINWKDPSQALTKLYPRQSGEDDDDMPGDPGSFFNFFEHDSDPSDVGLSIGNEIFPEAIEYFLGTAGGEDLESDDEDEDEDEDAEEIDLEKPRSKKQKV